MELELAYRPTGKQLAFHASTADEVLYGALPDFEAACKRAGVPYTTFARPNMAGRRAEERATPYAGTR